MAWTKVLTSDAPSRSTRSCHSAVVTASDKMWIFGGFNGQRLKASRGFLSHVTQLVRVHLLQDALFDVIWFSCWILPGNYYVKPTSTWSSEMYSIDLKVGTVLEVSVTLSD